MTQFTDRFLYTPPTPNVSKKFVEKSITTPQHDRSHDTDLDATRHFQLFEEPSKHPRIGIGKMRAQNLAFLPMESYANTNTKNISTLSPYRKECITLPQLNTCCEKKQIKSYHALPCSTNRLTHNGGNQKKTRLPNEVFLEMRSSEHCSKNFFKEDARKLTPYQWSSSNLSTDTRRPVNTNNLKSRLFYQSPQHCLKTTNENNSSVTHFLSPGIPVTKKQPQWFTLFKDVADASTARLAHMSSPLSSSTRCSSFSSASVASEAFLSRACQIRKSLKPTSFTPRDKTNNSKICSTNRVKDCVEFQCQNSQKGTSTHPEDCEKNMLGNWNKGYSETNTETNNGSWCFLKNSLIGYDGNEKLSGPMVHGREQSKPRDMCQKENTSHFGRSRNTNIHSTESMLNKHYGVNESLCTLANGFQNDNFLKTCRQKRACEPDHLETSSLKQRFPHIVEKNEKSSLTNTPRIHRGNKLQEDMLLQKSCSTCGRSHLAENNGLAVKDVSFCNNMEVKEPKKKKKCGAQYVPSPDYPHKVVDTLKSKQETFALNASVSGDSMRPISTKNGCRWTNAKEDELSEEDIGRKHEVCGKTNNHCFHKNAHSNTGSSNLMSPMLSKTCLIDEHRSICQSEDSVSYFNDKDPLRHVAPNIPSECSSATWDSDNRESQVIDKTFLKTNAGGKKKRGLVTEDLDTKNWKKPNPLNRTNVNTVEHMQDDLWKHYYHYRFQCCASQPKINSISKIGQTNQPTSFYNENIPPYSYETSTHHPPEKNAATPKNITRLGFVEHPCSACLDTNVVLKVLQKIAEENIKESSKKNKTTQSTHWILGDYFKKKQSLDSSETKHYLLRFGVTLTLTFLVLGAIVVLIFFSLRRHPKMQSHASPNFADDTFNLSSLDDNFGNDFYLTSNQML